MKGRAGSGADIQIMRQTQKSFGLAPSGGFLYNEGPSHEFG